MLARAVSMLLLAIQANQSESEMRMDPNTPALNVSSAIMADIPTLLLISSFSAFAYYLSRLSAEIEVVLHHQHSQAFLGIPERITGLPRFASNQDRRGDFFDGSNMLGSPHLESHSFLGSEGYY